MSQLFSKQQFLSTYDGIWNSFWLSTIFGIILLIAIQIFPKMTFRWIILLGGLIFVVGGILTIILADGSILLRLIVGLLFIVFGLLVLYSIVNKERRKAIIIGS